MFGPQLLIASTKTTPERCKAVPQLSSISLRSEFLSVPLIGGLQSTQNPNWELGMWLSGRVCPACVRPWIPSLAFQNPSWKGVWKTDVCLSCLKHRQEHHRGHRLGPVMASFSVHEDAEIALSTLRPGPWLNPTPDSICFLGQMFLVHT